MFALDSELEEPKYSRQSACEKIELACMAHQEAPDHETLLQEAVILLLLFDCSDDEKN